MKKLLYRIKVWFLTWFGNIRVSPYFPFLYYDDTKFAVSGSEIADIMEIAEPGDVLLRGYDSYLDSFFIKSSRKYSHAGIYVGNDRIIHAVAPNVTSEHLIDFCGCDRVAVLRPRKGCRHAIATAKRFLKNNVPYDFNFTHGKESLYCFELAAECYGKLELHKKTATALFGLLKKREKVFLSDSFFESKDFTLVYEHNPRFGISGHRG